MATKLIAPLLRLLTINLLVLAIPTLILELIFGRWLKHDPITAVPEIARTAGVKMSYRTGGLTGEDVLVNFERDQLGLRGFNRNGKPLAIVIGGSTGIEQNVPLDLTWAERLERQLNASGINIEIANGSVSGQTLFGNSFAVDEWVSKIPVKPSIFIVYYGHNDAIYTLAGIPPGGRDFATKGGANFDLWQHISANSAIAMLARELKGNYQSLVTGNRHLYDYRPGPLPRVATAKGLPIPAISKIAVGQLYRSAINNLISSFEKHYSRKTVIFVAQSNPNCRFISPDLYFTQDGSRNTTCERLAAFHRYVSTLTRTLDSQSLHQNCYRYIPLYLHNPYDRTGASDFIHANSRGSLGIANQLAPLVRATLKKPCAK